MHELFHLHQGNRYSHSTRGETKTFLFSYTPRRSLSPVRSSSPTRSFAPITSSSSLSAPSGSVRESTLIQRFNDLYARERLNAMDILRTISADYDNNQRICFTVVQVRTEEIHWSL